MPSRLARPATLLLGLALDRGLGDPPTALHPVGVIGRVVEALERRAPAEPPQRLRYGAVVAGALPLAAAAAAMATVWLADRSHRGVALGVDAALFSSTIALRTLLARAAEVQAALEGGRLDDARRLARLHLVSRETADLDGALVSAATIESVAENLSDGYVAPSLYYAVGGVPGAMTYRAANTLDAMWGYRGEPYTMLGRHAARLDDALNLVPARLTALAIVLAAALHRSEGVSARRALDTWIDEADSTDSPNAGQPMAAMSGALGVRLEKRGDHVLGAGYRAPGPADIARANRLAATAAALFAVATLGGLAMRAMTR